MLASSWLSLSQFGARASQSVDQDVTNITLLCKAVTAPPSVEELWTKVVLPEKFTLLLYAYTAWSPIVRELHVSSEVSIRACKVDNSFCWSGVVWNNRIWDVYQVDINCVDYSCHECFIVYKYTFHNGHSSFVHYIQLWYVCSVALKLVQPVATVTTPPLTIATLFENFLL